MYVYAYCVRIPLGTGTCNSVAGDTLTGMKPRTAIAAGKRARKIRAALDARQLRAMGIRPDQGGNVKRLRPNPAVSRNS